MNVKVLREIREVILKIRNMDSARRENTEHKPYHIPRVMAEKRKNASVRWSKVIKAYVGGHQAVIRLL